MDAGASLTSGDVSTIQDIIIRWFLPGGAEKVSGCDKMDLGCAGEIALTGKIYCPWDVISYVDRISADPYAEPEAFWINTSGNDLVKRFIDKADKTTQNEIERLITGEAIEKKARLDLAYNELDASIDNLWSVLFTTGYLIQTGRAVKGIYKLNVQEL